MNNTMNNKLFIELLGPAAHKPMPKLSLSPGSSRFLTSKSCVFVLSELGRAPWDKFYFWGFFLDEVPSRTDSEQGNSFYLKQSRAVVNITPSRLR